MKWPPGGGLVELQQELLRLLPGGKDRGVCLGSCSAACAALQSVSRSRGWPGAAGAPAERSGSACSLIARFSASQRLPRSTLL